MYADYFGLSENPFTISPNPKYLYMSTRHQEALAHLLFGVQEGGGFVQLTGEVGTGKTTLTRALLEQLPENVDPALIFNPKLTAHEFVAAICDELRIDYPSEQSSVKSLVDALNAYLLSAHANGRRVVLIVDEAQNFHPDVLEQIRLLTNLETTQQKLLQIILVGQPELRDLLARKELRQLAQRITARYHLVPMTLDETRGYIKHRLKVAGARHELFSSQAVRKLWKYSLGVPRLVNILADRCLLAAYAAEQQRVSGRMVSQAQSELNAVDDMHHRRSSGSWLMPLMFAAILMGGGLGYQLSENDVAVERLVSHIAEDKQPEFEPEPQLAPEVKVVVEPAPEPEIIDTPAEKVSFNADEFLQYLHDEAQSFDLIKAFTQMFTLWGFDFERLNGLTGCEKALTVYKRCFWGDSTWSEFVALNHPAIVWLKNSDNSEMKHYFVVHRIQKDWVHITVASKPLQIHVQEFEKLWPKRYLALWQPPSVEFDILRPGDRGKLILWLRKNIDEALGLQTEANGQMEVYDVSLKKRVELFQRQQGLVADGLVGELTMLHLNALQLDKRSPLLSLSEE